MAAALGVAYLIVQPDSADHAAQVFRSGLFEHEGLVTWDNFWFGGHHLPGYGLLLPMLSALIGPRLVGVLATIAAALLFSAIAYDRFGERARLGVVWFATATAISLFTGRLTFALGVAVALGAVLAAQRGHRFLAIFFAALTPLASPVAALFLACGVVAYAIAERSRRGLELAVVTVGMALLISDGLPRGRHRALRLLELRAGHPGDDRGLRRATAGGAPAPLRRRGLRRRPHRRLPDPDPDGRERHPDGFAAARSGARLRPLAPAALRPRPARPGADLLAVVAGGARPRGGERTALGERGLLRATDRLPPRHAASRCLSGRGAPRGTSLGVGLRAPRHLHRQGLGAPARPQAQSALLPVGADHRPRVPELARRPRRRLRRGSQGAARLRRPRREANAQARPAALSGAGLPQRRLDGVQGSEPIAPRDRRQDGEADPAGLRGRRARPGDRARQGPLDAVLVDRAGHRLRRAGAGRLHDARRRRRRAASGSGSTSPPGGRSARGLAATRSR